ncbi:L domain-like protein [Rhizoclosmatium globosum]|uniref:L domain-like protein n=1 Tax=Rhizoclosmatium globosum TaxID=329046 RepID=A0A1Y2C1L4_9FUNG|nr:L domain-like protein [Rhizoclosmatium globosum]|eukprot:ORY40767.1 L domain-like protein [Rhizoclosmatium globosum]
MCSDTFVELFGCSSLQTLDVSEVHNPFVANAIDSVAQVLLIEGSLPTLSYLKIWHWKTDNFDTINSMSSLRKLEIQTPAEDLSMIIWQHRYLKELTLNTLFLKTFPLLAELSLLTDLRLENNKISDLRPINQLINLETLVIQRCISFDFSPLQSLFRLNYLQIDEAPNLTDVEFLTKLTQLSLLILCETTVQNITPLSSCTNLCSLLISKCPISDISALVTLKNLKSIRLTKTNVSDLSPIGDLSLLEELNVSYSMISNLNPIATCTRLKTLEARNCRLTNEGVSELVHLTDLEEIIVDNNSTLSDLSFLRCNTTLTTLGISETAVEDVTILARISTLRVFYCSRYVKTLEPLRGIPLKRLTCRKHLLIVDYEKHWKNCFWTFQW